MKKPNSPHPRAAADQDIDPPRRRLLLAALAASTQLAPGRAAATEAPSAEVRVERDGERILVMAQADIEADRATAWSTLCDYDHLAEFIPGMSSSRTVSRTGAEAIVEQQGSAGFGPFRQRFMLRLAVKEELHESISAAGVGGDFKRFDARYELAALDAQRTRILYRAALEPSMPLPPLVGLPVMRSMIRDQFEALVREMERRTLATREVRRV
ncbi:MAG TPA: SRPBCC family protein [Burkholderiaceae bacterium]|nr:SRPBCC family protein [Burkholderiaceae bacterium]